MPTNPDLGRKKLTPEAMWGLTSDACENPHATPMIGMLLSRL